MYAERTQNFADWMLRSEVASPLGSPADATAQHEALLRRRLTSAARLHFYRAGQTLVGQEEQAPFVGLVDRGVLRVVNGLAAGDRRIVGFVEASGIFGHEFDGYRRYALEAATDLSVHQLDRRVFASLVGDSPALRARLLRQIRFELDTARDLILLLGQRLVTQRLALYLLGLRRRRLDFGAPEGPDAPEAKEPPFVLTVPVSRRDLADYLATTQESVSRGVHGLVRQGAIRILQPNRFEIASLDKLMEAAEGSTEEQVGPATRLTREHSSGDRAA